MNILQKIIEFKKKEISSRKSSGYYQNLPSKSRKPAGFAESLRKKGIGVIAEIKFKSPSAGIIRADLTPAEIALSYQNSSARAVSVLTDHEFFGGNELFLSQAAEKVIIPLLRKDFIIDTLQLEESVSLGASAVLLIADILTQSELNNLKSSAESQGLDCLIEVHDKEALKKALNSGAEIIGINNRNLQDFSVSLDNSLILSKLIPEGIIKVSESGICCFQDLKVLESSGFSAALIGETLMKSTDPGKKLKSMLEGL